MNFDSHMKQDSEKIRLVYDLLWERGPVLESRQGHSPSFIHCIIDTAE
jgi:hypothetical protein